jgi:hypothetical protein
MKYVAVIKVNSTHAQVLYFDTLEEVEKAGPAISLLRNTEENRIYCETSCEKFNKRYGSDAESKITVK